jgi:hypothetical protein
MDRVAHEVLQDPLHALALAEGSPEVAGGLQLEADVLVGGIVESSTSRILFMAPRAS